jgi:hypothetical protein
MIAVAAAAAGPSPRPFSSPILALFTRFLEDRGVGLVLHIEYRAFGAPLGPSGRWRSLIRSAGEAARFGADGLDGYVSPHNEKVVFFAPI